MQLYTQVMLKRKTLKQLVSLEFKSSTDLRMHASNITIYYCAYMTMKKSNYFEIHHSKTYVYYYITIDTSLESNRNKEKKTKLQILTAGRYQRTDKY